MDTSRTILISGLMAAAFLLAACSAQSAPPTQDVEAAVKTAIAQTRVVEDAVATSVSATSAAKPESTPTSTPPLPTATPEPPAPTQTEEKLAIAESDVATPEEKLLIGESDVDGDDGNDFLRSSSTSNQGRVILLLGFEQSDVTDPMVFRDRMAFQVEVFDTRAGPFDGAGIQDVTFRIVADDGSGEVVYERRAEKPGYCVFGGGESDCAVLTFAQASNRWPDPYGGEILNGPYLAKIDIVPVDGEPTQWRWRFNIEIPGQPDYVPPPPDTARIYSVREKDGRYLVSFQTFGFEPVVSDQHVHFFFNTVPPEQAGVPGQGPWYLYGGPSPFQGYGLDDRPEGATQMCVLVANPDHSVNQSTGNCFDLP